LAEQAPDPRATYRMPLCRQLQGQCPSALAGPTQRRLRITPRGRIHQRLQGPYQRRVRILSRFATVARLTNTGWIRVTGRLATNLQLGQPSANCAGRDTSRLRHGLNATPTISLRLGRRPLATHTLVHQRRKIAKSEFNPLNRGCILHSRHDPQSRKSANLFPCAH
jgi:hypothetical protein